VRTPFKSITTDIAGPILESERGNPYLLIAMDYFTKWPEVYTIPNQEASEVVDVLMTNFFFGIPRELHCDQSQNFKSQLLQEVLEHLGICKTGTTPLHPVTQHGGTICEDSLGAPEKGHLDAPKRLGQEATDLPVGLQSISPWHHRHNACQHGDQKRAISAL
jgi:hypothetical protein